MFDWIMRLLSSSATFLFPVFASYKALKTNDPQQVTPWLMYWVVIACVLVVEAYTDWLLRWFPFYYNLRCAFFLWLVLPQTQGATKLYLEYVHPFLTEHERDIENFISDAHEQLKAVGYSYLKQAIGHAQEIFFGIRVNQRPETPTHETYTNFLLSRFKLSPLSTPAAEKPQPPASPASEFYNSISSTLTSMATTAAAAPAPAPADKVEDEKAKFIAAQQAKLRLAMAALDLEMASMKNSGGDQGFFKSPSGASLSDFENISMTEAADGQWAANNWMKPQAPLTPPAERATAVA